jgi:hypothetical protein
MDHPALTDKDLLGWRMRRVGVRMNEMRSAVAAVDSNRGRLASTAAVSVAMPRSARGGGQAAKYSLPLSG